MFWRVCLLFSLKPKKSTHQYWLLYVVQHSLITCIYLLCKLIAKQTCAIKGIFVSDIWRHTMQKNHNTVCRVSVYTLFTWYHSYYSMGVEYILSKLFRTCMSKMMYPLYTITNSDTIRTFYWWLHEPRYNCAWHVLVRLSSFKTSLLSGVHCNIWNHTKQQRRIVRLWYMRNLLCITLYNSINNLEGKEWTLS